jgi:hypothetical protein
MHPFVAVHNAMLGALERELARQEGDRADLPPLAGERRARPDIDRLRALRRRRVDLTPPRPPR